MGTFDQIVLVDGRGGRIVAPPDGVEVDDNGWARFALPGENGGARWDYVVPPTGYLRLHRQTQTQ